MTMKYSTEPLPIWALSYLINSDPSGLNDEDIAIIDKWCEENNISVVCTASDKEGEECEPYFTHYSAFGLPTDVIDCHVIVYQ